MVAYLALGANLRDPVAQIDEAVRRLERPGVRPRRRARLYGSRPVGPRNQPDFVNSALEVETTLAPRDLLDAAKAVEAAMGREKTERWGPRSIDVDIALYGDVVWTEDDLVIPHRELCRRSFVLQPLADLCPDRIVPGTARTIQAWADAVDTPPITVLSPDRLDVDGASRLR